MVAKKISTIFNRVETILVSPVLLYRYLWDGYTYRRIYLGEGKYTILDSQDYYKLRDFRWVLMGWKGKFYVVRIVQVGNTRIKTITMHRVIKNAPRNKLVDHENSDPKDNRRDNLRFATREQNIWNRKKTGSRTTSKYLGVSLDKRRKKWFVRLVYHGKNINAGRFVDEIDAAKTHDKAARKYFGEFARLNFPDPPDKWPGLEYYIAKLYSWLYRMVQK